MLKQPVTVTENMKWIHADGVSTFDCNCKINIYTILQIP
jgi:hypothetical protein